MEKRNRFYIIIKYHYNPTTNEIGKKKNLPVLMLDNDGEPLEFDSKKCADDFVEIMNINTNQGFHYETKEIGNKFLNINRE